MDVLELELRVLRINVHEFDHGTITRLRRPDIAFVLPRTLRDTGLHVVKYRINDNSALVLLVSQYLSYSGCLLYAGIIWGAYKVAFLHLLLFPLFGKYESLILTLRSNLTQKLHVLLSSLDHLIAQNLTLHVCGRICLQLSNLSRTFEAINDY